MSVEHFLDLYRYTFWANRRVWECVVTLDDAQFDAPADYSIGSIHNQVAHTFGVEYWWFHFLKEDALIFVTDEMITDRDSIRAAWDALETYILDFIASLTPEALERKVKPSFWEEEDLASISVWQAMTQVAMHSMDHRSQTLALLHKLGAPTVEQDYLNYLHNTTAC